MGDHEGAEISTGRGPVDPDVLYLGRRWSALAPGDELVDALLGSFHDGLDAAVGQIADLSAQPEAHRLLLRAGAVEHALHTAADQQIRPVHSSSSRKPFSSTTRTPSSCALFGLLPASPPATTRSVFRLTDPETRPPRRARARAVASPTMRMPSA